jgi:branched-subunit amino acid ABC-type transport system permease component
LVRSPSPPSPGSPGLGLAALAAFLYAPWAGLLPTVRGAPLFRAFAGIFPGGLTSMYGAIAGVLTVGVLTPTRAPSYQPSSSA